jgi:L-serine deaminase
VHRTQCGRVGEGDNGGANGVARGPNSSRQSRQAIKTMRDTRADMKDKYKEPSRGGLALNVVEC